MAVESVVLGTQLQASLQALKSTAQSEAAVVSLVQQAVEAGKSQTSSSAYATDPSRLVDVVA